MRQKGKVASQLAVLWYWQCCGIILTALREAPSSPGIVHAGPHGYFGYFGKSTRTARREFARLMLSQVAHPDTFGKQGYSVESVLKIEWVALGVASTI